MTTASTELASVRYIVDDVQAALDFYTTHLGFTVAVQAPPFADVRLGPLRLLLSGPATSGARATPDDAATAGRNRIHLIGAVVLLAGFAAIALFVPQLDAEQIRDWARAAGPWFPFVFFAAHALATVALPRIPFT